MDSQCEDREGILFSDLLISSSLPSPPIFGVSNPSTSSLYEDLPSSSSSTPLLAKKSSQKSLLKSGSTQTLEDYISVDSLVNRINAWPTFDNSSPEESWDENSEILNLAEEEAALLPITKKNQLRLFDSIQKSQRFVDTAPFYESEDLDESDPDSEAGFSEERFQEMFLNHVKRKRIRKKVRNMTESELKPKDHPKPSKPVPPPKPDPSPVKNRKNPVKKAKESKKKTPDESKKPTVIEKLTNKRRALWSTIVKKEVVKAVKSRNTIQKEKIGNAKKSANQCARYVRQKTMASQKAMKESAVRAKKLTKEIQAYWKKTDRVEKQIKRQQEKVAEERRKLDVELLESKRQQRKLNFLITQTELYAHFVASKVNSSETECDILQNLEENETSDSVRLAELDDYDPERAKELARVNAAKALEAHKSSTVAYDLGIKSQVRSNNGERTQPHIFHGKLKGYQLKGMNWLIDLYDKGINGILADEMGLGKTVQALSLLAYIAEVYDIWGPFLVITPASTLHNWQQEVTKFLPDIKVIPYWGAPSERKVLRQFWDLKNLHTKSASFHLVITSYQLIVSDFKYFNRIKWQYLVLDEAQAIKSSSSQRWKMLLEFKCRNRLLLSGTPIQNSMAELWSLLHFVMPTLFDSHQEFNDWFSKDIESTAENKTQIDQKQIGRLHLILKPFMLRRIKKDVENELTDKLEVLMYCPLTIRQKLLYMGLKKKIRIEDLLQGLGSQTQNSALASSLMNLVMQFRKVCNHPELFERREPRSPFIMSLGPYILSKLLYHECLIEDRSQDHLLKNKFNIFNPLLIHESLFHNQNSFSGSSFAYTRLIDLSPVEHHNIFQSSTFRWVHASYERMRIRSRRKRTKNLRNLILLEDWTFSIDLSSELVFTGYMKPFLHHLNVLLKSVPESVSHRLIRTRASGAEIDGDYNKSLIKECPHVSRPPEVLKCEPCFAPSFLYDLSPSIGVPGRTVYASDRKAAWDRIRFETGFEKEICLKYENPDIAQSLESSKSLFNFNPSPIGGLLSSKPLHGWSNIVVPDKLTLVSDAGKLFVLDSLLARLKEEGHRVLIYSQMTRMIDLLEEYMVYKKHTFMRLDGSSKIHERRDMVADFQQRSDIFAFLLSTRAGGLGINLTAADTVIFYDSDWNPTVDQQAMDRAHRLGQTKQVTVYRLVCKGTIEERILQRAREKSEIQRMVIQGGIFKGKNELRPNEVVSLLLDDEEVNRRINSKKDDNKRKIEEADQFEGETSRDFESKKSKIDDESAPLFDFLGEKLGPEKTKKSTGNKRGRPKTKVEEKDKIKRGPGRPKAKLTHLVTTENKESKINITT